MVSGLRPFQDYIGPLHSLKKDKPSIEHDTLTVSDPFMHDYPGVP
jgi:hypothetical protein